MDILNKIKSNSELYPDRIAIQSEDSSITYRMLEEYSNRLANYIENEYSDNKNPIIVYGHKSPLMIVCFLAVVKSGRAYCPIDISVPLTRVEDIINEVNPPIILSVNELQLEHKNIIDNNKIEKIISSVDKIEKTSTIGYEDVFYIIFTSGSTGKPKGVQITYECLNNYLEWSVTLGNTADEKVGKKFLNQAPFSFDLSVMDLYTCLASAGTLCTLSKETQMDYKKMFSFLEKCDINVWVSTPSFIEMCLVDENYSDRLLPNLEVFLFCGEVLTNRTVTKLQSRFKDAKIVNTYGPTESTVAITSVVVTPEVNENNMPLPVGKPKEGTYLKIINDNGVEAKEGEHGEVVIVGNTVTVGYFNRPELTEKSFFHEIIDGVEYRGYRTGDEGYIKDNMLFYCGRIDLQVKLHGYRMEIEDIENNMLKLKEIEGVVVTPKIKDGKVKSLTAFIIYEEEVKDKFKLSQELKKKLLEYLPKYMIPKKFVFVDKFPITINGKVDRKYLGGLA